MVEHSSITSRDDTSSGSRGCRRSRLGRSGEDAAVSFYEALGLELLERNWRAGRFAEVDLILRSPSGLLVFAEVKTRMASWDSCLESGFEAVSLRKQRKIVTASRLYTAQRALIDTPCRFDVLVISCDTSRQPGKTVLPRRIVHVADAFSGQYC